MMEESHFAARSARFKRLGLISLAAGFALAAVIYFWGPDGSSSDENILMSDYYKRQDVDTQRMWGNSGALVLGITRSFRRGSTYSIIVLVAAVVVCAICFFLADHSSRNAKKA